MAAETDGWAIYFEAPASYQFNNHRFYGTGIEHYHNGIQFNQCANVILAAPRFEDVDDNWVASGAYIYDLVWTIGAPVLDETKVSFNIN